MYLPYNVIVGSFKRIHVNHTTLSSFIASFFPSCFFSPVYFVTYLLRHVFTFRRGVSLARFISRVAIIGVIITATHIDYPGPGTLLGLKIVCYTSILCTILVFLIGVPLSQAKIARGLAEQVRGRHYNRFINLIRKRAAAKLKSRIKGAAIVEIDAIMDDMIGPLFIAGEE